MKLVRPRRRYDSIEQFYAELPDVDRRLSGERDYGVWWTWSHDRGFPRYRVSLVVVTGELYVIRQSPPESLSVLAAFDDVDECEWALEDWAEHCGPDGLDWLVRRLELCVPHYVCGHCLFYTPSKAPVTFDNTVPCPRCGRLAWGETAQSARERRRRPAEESCS